jgi:hypothetical protein
MNRQLRKRRQEWRELGYHSLFALCIGCVIAVIFATEGIVPRQVGVAAAAVLIIIATAVMINPRSYH